VTIWRTNLERAIGLLCLVAVLFALTFPLQDPDTFWHLAYGRAMVAQGAFINTEIFSYTANGAFLGSHSQLAQILLYLIWLAGGVNALLGFKVLIGAATFFLVNRTARLFGPGAVAADLLALLVLLAGMSRFVERPELFSILLFATLLLLLFGFAKGAFSSRVLWALPPVLVLWDYLHGALYGLVVLLLFVAGESLKALVVKRYPAFCWGQPLPAGRLKALWTWCGVTLVAMAAHPNGLLNYAGIFRVSSNTAEYAMYGEFMPTQFIAQFFWFWVVAGIAVALCGLCCRRLDLTALLVALPFLYLGLKFNRATLFFAMASVPLIAHCAAVVGARLATTGRWRRVALLLPVLVLAAVPYYKQVWGPDFLRFGHGCNPIAFPVGSARFVKDVDLKGNMFNSDGVGGYLAFVLGPQRKIFNYNQPGVFTALTDYMHRPETRQRWNIAYAIIADAKEYTMFIRDGFVPVYREPNAMVLLKVTPEHAALLERFKIRFFDPLKTPAELERMSQNPYVAARLGQELSVYLTYRHDPDLATLLARLLNPDNPALSVALDQRRAWLEAALKGNGEESSLLLGLGLVAYRQGDLAGAGSCFDAVLKSNPADISALMNRGYVYYDSGAYPQAAATFAQVVAEVEGLADAHYAWGLAALRSGDKAVAQREFERFLQLAPDSPRAAKVRQLLMNAAP